MNPNKQSFSEAGHVYRLDGRRVPSVTDVLRATGISPDYSRVEPVTLENKRLLGTAVDAALVYLQEGDLDPDSVDPGILPRIEAFQLFCKDFDFKPVKIHLRMWPVLRGMHYGGQLDVIGLAKYTLLLLDFKCVEGPPEPAWGCQTAAYAHGAPPVLEAPFRYQRASLQLKENGRYHYKEWNDPGDIQEFEWALGLVWKRLNRGEDIWG